ncbi:tRNA (adenosine(37)-N6)-threonylcarbamoyltransferase complex ATPase subunit type 1 TsaE [Flexithrix dorotheae]|uniref:tRNA (adenosine(37)-N6)-threonylcarbamoyltransferase complex ATPase subunit type 1 TsaE n=1 Tax=Flexithrix dorotheae TaxID=70993 RepID=UPI00036644B6|nr:tRNA (adenosine(37)-N6)-threonylcarbamoyltransferase complex ATPase subunit type 1 TsaE [Flexithrix dorotheae]
MNSLILTSSSLADLNDIAGKIVEFSSDQKIWLFEGEMGVGKTTLIKHLAERLGSEDLINSPTYGLVNEYEDGNGNPFYHFDFYRIKNEVEALEMGCEEYFYSGNICLIEWPSKIEKLIPENHLMIAMELGNENQRIINLTKHG